ncbi:PAAR domain-containing protein [Herbaspirillum sp. RTI4]|uniref:PAAR domain-containing protein n=1 Tax=Herbaspirillum sp. RTI4 TaxID=3048640 RepID=UPI002AB389E8|nr:PAAR domain-containing protein [Herbaspirillum sp. RTI4]MDY7579537.1 PAAR domain-containing protein [Herbaspirillum sp. RTI4]MEA9981831.1 PAAR domain-containing protein [Herbaspirillum sp. RTI4]
MGKRYFIHEGDKTTVGGVVLPSSLTTINWHGIKHSYIGDQIDCQKCNSTGTIEASGTRHTIALMGRIPALNGDLCICKCHPAPLLVASQTTEKCSGEPDLATAAHTETEGHDRRVQMTDALTGVPLAHHPYRLEHEGGYIDGHTDADGMTLPVHTGDASRKVQAHIIGIDNEEDANG